MITRLPIFLTALFLVALTADARQMGGGTYTSGPDNVVSTVPMSNGNVMITSTGTMKTMAKDENHPLHGIDHNCVQILVASAEEVPVAISGICQGTNADGDGMTMWWRAEEMGTEKCANACGVWAIYNGYGAMEEMRGEGKFVIATQAEDGANEGTWEGHVGKGKMKDHMKKKEMKKKTMD